MPRTSLSLLVSSSMLTLVSCTATAPEPEPLDLDRLAALAEEAPEAPRPGHTHPGALDEVLDHRVVVEEIQDPERKHVVREIRIRRLPDGYEHRRRHGGEHRARQRHHHDHPWREDCRHYRGPKGGFYIGGNFGVIDGNESSGELENKLNRRTPAGRDVRVALDDTDYGWKGYLGYRFTTPFAVELAYTGLEGPDSSISAPVIDSNLVADVGDLHPKTGRGPSLSLLAFPYAGDRFSAFAKIGMWYWVADIDTTVNNSLVNNSPDGLDFVVGVGAQYRLFDELSARLDYERYFLDDDGVDMLSIGLSYIF